MVSDLDYDGGYFTNGWLERNFVVKGVSSGKHSYKRSRVTNLKKLVKMKLIRELQILDLLLINTNNEPVWSSA